jgi:hypothetical protein
VRPNPDPETVETTEWMSNASIQKEREKPSRHWIDSGTGDLGKVHLEILDVRLLDSLAKARDRMCLFL